MTNNIFSKDGIISQYFIGYEHRPQQTEMYETISGALAVQGRAYVVIAAGTGVGKTFAYLIPLIQHSIATGKPVVVSTNTINLQEQIAYKDITFLKTLPIWGENDFEVALGKGRSNYLCLRRLNNAQLHQTGLFEELSEVKELKEINKWSYELLKTKGDGSLSALSFVPQNSVWSKVCSEYDNCPGRHCVYYNKCFYQRARQKLWSANLIVVNHPLLVIDAMLRKDKANILPPYEALVIDEAHRLEGVAQDHLGLEISNGRINYLLNNLYNPRNDRGFLKFLSAQAKPNQAKDIVANLRETSDRFFAEVIQWSSTKAPSNGRVKKSNFDGTITNTLSEALMELYIALGELKKRTDLSRAQGAREKTPSAKPKRSKKCADETDAKDGYDGFELDAYIRRTLGLATEIESFFKQTLSSTV
ncbi:MAG: ATP-dependent DNA helicase [Planctomycetes bacterium]|nr:ATP-dependent DNA helicase [Planctomycetota bacterium]